MNTPNLLPFARKSAPTHAPEMQGAAPALSRDSSLSHEPVLVDEVVAVLAPREGELHVDGTFGGGGYSRALLDASACTVWAIDRDPEAVARGEALARARPGRLTMLHGRFGSMETLLAAHGVTAVDGIVLDLGLSSFQLDDRRRGFSFREDGPLDMRMDFGTPPPEDGQESRRAIDAATLVNSLEEKALADLLYHYGEERLSRAIARAIVAARLDAPILTTARLAAIVRDTVNRRRPKDGGARARIDPATRSFQALRIAVNDELGELERGLLAAERLLRPGGRLAVVSFHSLEDRSVKSFLSTRCGSSARPSRHQPSLSSRGTTGMAAPSFHVHRRRPILPTADEIARNPRARSARLRSAIRTEAPPFPASAPLHKGDV